MGRCAYLSERPRKSPIRKLTGPGRRSRRRGIVVVSGGPTASHALVVQEKHGPVKAIGKKGGRDESILAVQKLAERPPLAVIGIGLVAVPIVEHENAPILKRIAVTQAPERVFRRLVK